MDKKRIGALSSVLALSMLLAACDAITAQNIPSTTSTAFNNGAGLGGANVQMGMPGDGFGGGFGGKAGGMREAIDSDFIGRIVSVNGDTVTLELLDRDSTAMGDGAQSPGGAAEGQTEWVATGEERQLALSSDVDISFGMSTRSGSRQGERDSGSRGEGSREQTVTPDAASDASTDGISELKAGQIVMVWHAEGTQTVERVRVLE